MPLQSVAERRARLLDDSHLRGMLSARPELAGVIDAFLWGYPHSPGRSQRRLLLFGVGGVCLVVGIAGWRIRR
jgi:hypothetical protein